MSSAWTGMAATTDSWNYRPTRLAKAVRRPVKPRKAVAPGPLCVPAMSDLRRSVISSTALPARYTNRAVFPGSSDSRFQKVDDCAKAFAAQTRHNDAHRLVMRGFFGRTYD